MDLIERQAQAIQPHSRPITGTADDYDALLDRIGDARVVLLGEASHGTHEFYRERARITQRLIEEKGFRLVAVEADWPDAYEANRWVRGTGDDGMDAAGALSGFRRFPRWMWRNDDVASFIRWLREHNAALASDHSAVGFYGLDLYSLFTSIEAVLEYLDTVDPDAARRARSRYGCFDHFGENSQEYGYAAEFGLTQSCEDEVVQQLTDLRERATDLVSRDGRIPPDEYFFAEQNARVVRNAEEYYRTMFRGRVASWNLRDRHMVATLDALLEHFDRPDAPARAVVWAHNSHLGDARATEMSDRGELNVGQLARERFGDAAFSVGFTTYSGTVTAASDWGGPAQRKRVRPGLEGSYERLLHAIGIPAFLLDPGIDEIVGALKKRLERAIGVIYRPESERASHYFHAELARQFDTVIHIDETRAIEPLDRAAAWSEDDGEPETYPSGI